MSERALPWTDARTGSVLAAASAFLAAAFFIPYKAATGYAPADAVVIALLGPAAVFNTLASLRNGGGLFSIRRLDVLVAAIIAVFTVTGNVCMTEALSLIDAGVTSVLMQTQVFFVAIFGWLLLRERVTARFALGAAVAVGGVALTRWQGVGEVSPGLAGPLWAFGAALSFGLVHVITRKYIARINPVAVNALRLWLAVGVLLLLPGRATAVADMPAVAWYLGAIAALFGPFGARLAIMFALRFIPAAAAVLFGLLTPVFAFVLEFAVLGAAPSTFELLGAAVILAGVAIPVLHTRTRG